MESLREKRCVTCKAWDKTEKQVKIDHSHCLHPMMDYKATSKAGNKEWDGCVYHEIAD